MSGLRSRNLALGIPALMITIVVISLTWALPTELPAQEAAGERITPPSEGRLLGAFRWRSIGPVGQGGRVDDIEVSPTDPHVFFVGFATGGLWKTTNNGVTFRPVFDDEGTGSIGDIAIAPSDPDIVWVGTGEANNRQSSSFGAGMYRSVDGGETFTYVGLEETQSIARIVVHPTNPDVVWVAATGHLFGPNPERGVFKTVDGGASWAPVLYVDDDTGATDLVIDPSNPDVLFAATYQRRRTACCFVGGGPGSGIWRSDDGGEGWSRLSGEGLPRGVMGRIALAMTPADANVIYAQIEVAADREERLSPEDREEQARLAEAGTLPPDPQYTGLWRSSDKGRTWEFRSNQNGRPMYFSQVRVDPTDPETVYVVAQDIHRSTDGGREFERLDGYGHVDHHAFWIDPRDSDHLMIGNDGSVDVSYDGGQAWESLRGWAVGQPYHVSVDMRRPYFVCTGLQDNGTWCGPSAVRGDAILAQDWYRVGRGDGFYSAVDPTDYTTVYSESQNGNLRRTDLESGLQWNIRPQPPSGQRRGTNIDPAPQGAIDLRWNWNTPFILSPHDPGTLYLGGNRLFKSSDQGLTWTMGPDLTMNIDRDESEIMGQRMGLPRCNPIDRGEACILSRNDGVRDYGTIVSLAESDVSPGLLWVGSDDGRLQVSRDDGQSWTEVGQNIPGGTMGYYVSRVEPSHFDPATAYASLDGHRSDDLRPFIFVTHDYGESWESISGNLPDFGNVNTVRQDPRNPRLLYAGTEFGFFISLDEGVRWDRFMNGLPTTRIDDVLVHPRDNDLVLASHGRSIWVLDDVTALQDLTPEILAEDVYFFDPREAVLWNTDRRLARAVPGDKSWRGENPPAGTSITYYLKEAAPGSVSLTIIDPQTGNAFRTLDGPGNAGMNRVRWDLRGDPPRRRRGRGRSNGQGPLARPDVYRVTLAVGDRLLDTSITVREDVWMDER